MRVLLKLILDCEPDAAWRAIRSPTVFREVSSPLFTVESLEPHGFPSIWTPGGHPVRMRGGGLLPLGSQTITLTFDDSRDDGVRIMRDAGGERSGVFDTLTSWDHRLAVAPDPAGADENGAVKTLYRDQLKVSAGALTPAAWYSLWTFWQWRGHKMRQLAPTWAYDPPTAEAAPVAEPTPKE